MSYTFRKKKFNDIVKYNHIDTLIRENIKIFDDDFTVKMDVYRKKLKLDPFTHVNIGLDYNHIPPYIQISNIHIQIPDETEHDRTIYDDLHVKYSRIAEKNMRCKYHKYVSDAVINLDKFKSILGECKFNRNKAQKHDCWHYFQIWIASKHLCYVASRDAKK